MTATVTWANLRDALAEVDQWVDAYPADTVLALWEARAWEMLHYDSWEALCDSRGWTKRVALPRPERREVVATLRQEGMSTRAIASATGSSEATVRRDIQAGGASNDAPVRGTDGKTYAPTVPVRPTVVSTPTPDEPVEVLTAEEWAAREGYELVTSETQIADVIDLTDRPHVANNSGNNEWYTPAEYIEAARDAFRAVGECPEDRDDCWDRCTCEPITTDPASSDAAQQRVSACHYYTADDDGLVQQWRGNVWMNPPYSGDLVGRFIDKLLVEMDAGRVRRAIVLVNNATETQWAHRLLSAASAVCFPKGRIRYLTPDGLPANAPLQGQMFVYLARSAPGNRPWGEFEQAFSKFGPVVVNP